MQTRILMAAPFDSNGRYKGGIHTIVSAVQNFYETCYQGKVFFSPYNTCRVNRSRGNSGKLSLANLQNTWEIYHDIIRAVKKNEANVLYYHSSVRLALLKDLLILRHAKKKTGIKTVLHIHFAEYKKIMTGKPALDREILRLLKNYVDKLVFLSAGTRDEFLEKGIDKVKTEVIYNFSPVEFEPREIEAKLSRKEAQPQLLFVGSIDKRKGLFELLEVLGETDKAYQIHVCGACSNSISQSTFDTYKTKLGNQLVDHGYVSGEEKKKIFLNADILVLPSHGEGLPMVIMEAFHAGCGVLSTTVGAIPEIVKPPNGILVSPGDKMALRGAIETMLTDIALVDNMKKQNIIDAQSYTLEHFCCQVFELCQSLCSDFAK